MAAGKYNFTIEQGSYFRRVITWQPGNDTADLTGYSARIKIKSNDDGTTIISLTTTPSANADVITIDGPSGTMTVFISALTTAAMSFVSGAYDLELVPADPGPGGAQLARPRQV